MRLFYVLLSASILAGNLAGCNSQLETGPVRLLVLSGSNNHDWEATTNVLTDLLQETSSTLVDVTLLPDTLVAEDLKAYDVILSNWNSWPENDLRWPADLEVGLLEFVRGGGGLVFFHASTSVFYGWPDFQQISTGAWIEQTHHGENELIRVSLDDQQHPITAGLSDFNIFDELWIDAGANDAFQVLGSAASLDEPENKQPAIMVQEFGEGRIFHTILGHDARALRNTGLRTLLTRAVEWASTGQVSSPIPQDLQQRSSDLDSPLSWVDSDSSITLHRGSEVVWRYNFNTRHGKPFFHPVYLGRNRMTSLSPDDHLWHLGQWFTWKYINGVNYWEYVGDTYESEGVTEIVDINIDKHPEFAAEIQLRIVYQPVGQTPVLEEFRTIHVYPPTERGISMDYFSSFTALTEEVLLDRTPIPGEPGGVSWGGYGGLSIRFNQDFTEATVLSADGSDANVNGTGDKWLYMGFSGLHGGIVGTALFIPEKTRRDGEAWYLIQDPALPFFFYSPAHLYLKPRTLRKGEKISLAYRVDHISGDVTREMLQSEYEKYAVLEENH